MINGISFDDKPDRLSELLRDSSRNDRHDIWLWLHLFLRSKAQLKPNTCNGVTMRKVIADELSADFGLIKKIPDWKDKYLVHDERLRWLTHDERQIRWLSPRVEVLTGKFLPEDLVHLIGRPRIVAMLDAWHVDISEKAKEIENLHAQWRRHIAQDNQFEWFMDKKEGAKRCICAWEWLEKNHLEPLSEHLPINNHQELLMFFDKADLRSYEQKVIIQEIKKRWNRQQFDERNADKKQVNLMLSKAVIAQLDALAETHSLKRAQVIESLVVMETSAGRYLADS